MKASKFTAKTKELDMERLRRGWGRGRSRGHSHSAESIGFVSFFYAAQGR